MSALISLRDVVKIHAPGSAAEVRALDGVSFEIEQGAYVAIVGESGSGKTTLMHLLGALDIPTSGSVSVAGHDLSRSSRGDLQRFRSREVGFVFQGFNLVASLDAIENVALAAHYARRPAAEGLLSASQLLEEVGLAQRMHHRPAQLSGGQQQRVAIARALVNQPSLLLADEPTGELDTKTADGILDLLDRLNTQRGQTIVVVTHNPDVWRRASRIIKLTDGRLA